MIERPSGIRGTLPSFRYVSDADLDKVHDAALKVLEEPGIRVITKQARTSCLTLGAR